MNELTPDQRKIREAKILSKVNHPNILKLYDWWVEKTNEALFLYMQLEYVSYPGFKY
jgi:serine/threonine protein kinase